MTDIPVCAWLSPHAPTADQRASLRAYEIVQIAARYTSPYDAVHQSFRICDKRFPALYVAVLPEVFLPTFVALVAQQSPPTVVLQARMLPPDYRRHWSGEWRALIVARDGTLEWYTWSAGT